ncbi:hypothetical protein ACFYO2_26470 [Streptomyces sp. NPDC006602]|uniref:hypothetical protein n=1 Tax=Streptomyces sp. NPDC006602 TaxID=3364751 RepID=UPI003688ACC2
MAVTAETTSANRERGLIPVGSYSFHREYANHDVFEVSVTDAAGTFRYEVRAWGNMIRSVEAFTSSIAHVGICQRAKVDIYRTGYALVNGYNVRVTPLS